LVDYTFIHSFIHSFIVWSVLYRTVSQSMSLVFQRFPPSNAMDCYDLQTTDSVIYQVIFPSISQFSHQEQLLYIVPVVHLRLHCRSSCLLAWPMDGLMPFSCQTVIIAWPDFLCKQLCSKCPDLTLYLEHYSGVKLWFWRQCYLSIQN